MAVSVVSTLQGKGEGYFFSAISLSLLTSNIALK